MKQCPNPNCIIYTRLDDLPDTYLRCPQCNEPLIESPNSTSRLPSSYLAEETTSPYVPVSSPGYVQQPLVYPDADDYDQYNDPELEGAAEPLRTLPAQGGFGLRTAALFLAGLVVVAACAALALSVGGRVLGRTASFNTAAATQTAIASLRPAVNTPIAILPTIPAAGSGSLAPAPGSAPPADVGASGNPPPILQTTGNPPTQAPPPLSPGSPAPVLDALMCARLEGGAPVGVTNAYRQADPFNLAVRANFGPGGVTSILTRWYGPDGALIYQLRQAYAQPGAYYSGFTLNKATLWSAGDYRVDVHTNDAATPAQSVTFSVIP